MIKLIKFILAIIFILPSISCTPGKPYEIKSPCVAKDSDDIFSPCARRPVNLMKDIV
jgi:hypothetical protein